MDDRQQSLLRHTAPQRSNLLISFPDHSPGGRISVIPGTRVLDWENGGWVVYEKDGARWFQDEFGERDYAALQTALRGQL